MQKDLLWMSVPHNNHAGLNVPSLWKTPEGRYVGWNQRTYSWEAVSRAELERWAWQWVTGATMEVTLAGGQKQIKPVTYSQAKMKTVFQALECQVPVLEGGMPQWLGPKDQCPVIDVRRCWAFTDQVVDLVATHQQGQWVTVPRSPLWFDRMVTPLKFDDVKNAPHPSRWVQCLAEWGNNDPMWGELLERMLAYGRVPWRGFEVFGVMIGRPRCGKTLVSRVARGLVGKEDWASLKMTDLTRNFGLQNLLNQPRLLVLDEIHSLSKSVMDQASAMIKCIVGHSPFQVDAKYQVPVGAFESEAFIMMIGNQLPDLNDREGSVTSKAIPLAFKNSFVGKTDPMLPETLQKELESGGIVKRILEAAVRVVNSPSGTAFPLPGSSMGLLDRMKTYANPADAFLGRHFRKVDDKHAVSKDVVYREYRVWCRWREEDPKDMAGFFKWLYSNNSWGLDGDYRQGSGKRVLKGIALVEDDGSDE